MGVDRMNEKKLICCECSYEAELIDRMAFDELLCESCAKDRALAIAETNNEFFRIKNLEDEEYEELLKKQENE